MSILTMNLRPLYQRRGLWVVYGLFGLFAFAGIYTALFDTATPRAGEGRFIGLVLLAFMVGLLAAVFQMEILIKPFAFCLPGHGRMVRKFIFLIAAVTNLLSSLLFLFYPGLSLTRLPLVLCSAFFAGMVFYVAGAWLAFGTKQPMAFVGFMIAAFIFGGKLNLHGLLERAIVDYPLLVIVPGLLCSFALWRRLGDPELARRSCLLPWIGFQTFNYAKMRDSRNRFVADHWNKLGDHPKAWVENLFIARMERRRPLSGARAIWGTLYTTFGLFLSRWYGALAFALFLAVLLGYLGPRMWGVVVFVPMILVSYSKPSLFSSMLPAGGRAERFHAALAVAAVSLTLLVLFFSVIVVLSALLSSVLPDLAYGGVTISYQTVSVKCLYPALIFLPIAGILHLLLHRKPILLLVASMALVYAIIMGSIMSRTEGPTIYSLQTTILLSAAAWTLFTLVLHRIATRHCLV